MRTKHLAGKEALRVEVFMPDMNPADERRARKYIGTQFDLSLIFRHNGIHEMPGPDVEHRVCYQLYMHDEVTPGGILVADSCQLPEYYLDAVTSDPIEETITLTMNNGYEFVVDLTEMLSKYDTMIRRNAGQGTMTFEKGGIDIITWTEGSTYTLDSLSNSLTIHAADGNDYVISMTTWDFSVTGNTLTIMKNGATYLSVNVGSDVSFSQDGSDITINIDGTDYTFSLPDAGSEVSFADNGNGSFTITVDGTSTTFNTGVKTIEQVGESSFVATLADGTQIGWTAEVYNPAFVYLTDPVIYVRPTGSASPTITTQSDLTEANAFNTLTNARAWLENTLVSGTIYFDVEEDLTGTFTWKVSNLHGADQIEVYGSGGDATKLVVGWGNSTNSYRDGFRIIGELNVLLRDMTFTCEGASPYAAAIAASTGANVQLGGDIVFDGATDATQSLMREGKLASIISYSPHTNAPSMTMTLDITGPLQSFIRADNASTVISNTLFQRTLTSAITIGTGIVYARNNALVTFSQDTGDAYATNFAPAGASMFDGPAFSVTTLSILNFVNLPDAQFPHSDLADFLSDADTTTYTLDKTSAVVVGASPRFGTSGTDYS